MGPIKRIKTFFNNIRALSISDIDSFLEHGYLLPTSSGASVSPETAVTLSAVYNAIYLISSSLASLPLKVYRKTPGGKVEFTSTPVYGILHDAPNSYTSAMVFFEAMMWDLLAMGNCYAVIERDRFGRPIGLHKLDAKRIEIYFVNGKKLYVYKENNVEKKYKQSEIFHVPGPGYNGIAGKSVIALARESIGLGLSYQEYNSKNVGRGATLSGVLEHPDKLGEKALSHLKESFANQYEGLENAGKTLILEEGMKYNPISQSNKDLQFIESRTFQIDEIARWFNIPPHKLKELSRATFSNIEQQQIEFVQDTIRPWAVRIEQEAKRQLIAEQDAFAEFTLDGLLRGDTKSRMEALHIMRTDGIISANEWREKENFNKIQDGYGEEYLVPLNMIPASQLGQTIEPPGNTEERSLKISNRSFKAMSKRKKIARDYIPRFMNTAQKLIDKDSDLLERSRKNLEKGYDLFEREIKAYYDNNESEYINAYVDIYRDFGRDLRYPIIEEINRGQGDENYYNQQIDRFGNTAAVRHITASRGQLLSCTTQEELDDLQISWDNRAGRIATRETVDGESGLATVMFFAFGLSAMWVTTGDSCPYCNSLDGKIISRGQYFAKQGDEMNPDGAERPLRFNNNVSHPGAHPGCDCTVVSV